MLAVCSQVDDKLVTALQDDCNKWVPGLTIVAVRITKPKIPDSVLKNYEVGRIGFAICSVRFVSVLAPDLQVSLSVVCHLADSVPC
jgi:hypothetical protein